MTLTEDASGIENPQDVNGFLQSVMQSAYPRVHWSVSNPETVGIKKLIVYNAAGVRIKRSLITFYMRIRFMCLLLLPVSRARYNQE